MAIPTIEIQDAPVVSDIHKGGKAEQPWVRWFQLVKKQPPFFPVDTTAGSQTVALQSGAEYLNREHLYLKSSSDANTVTITGAFGGSVVLSSQGQKARFRYDGKNWWPV